ncbi:MAG TPA: HD domain-containing protein [Candidatus Babeliales bacterium]|nr:HD domain-containing protein [Candidatus Babeliales bacterium]
MAQLVSTEQWQKTLTDMIAQEAELSEIIKAIHNSGGYAFLVGGAVRDLLLGKETKDLDIEVHGLTLEQLAQVLEQFGYVNYVGKAYGVLRLEKLDIDWSIPRKDRSGRKPEVEIDPDMPLEQAFKRRDLTINAMGIDLHTLKLVDPFNGTKDLEHRIFRPTDQAFFIEDPLRLFRVMQFVSRFDGTPTLELDQICKEMDLSDVSRERIEQEFFKMLLRSKRPSLGIRWLADIGRLKDVLPELYQTIGILQNPDWHPEGDVFEHTMQALDQAALLDYDSEEERIAIMFAALCHDLGKSTTTKYVDGKWRSIGHAAAGVSLTTSLLKRIIGKKELIKTIGKLVKYHMEPYIFIAGGAGPGAYKRLASKLAPQTNIAQLVKVNTADKRGRQGAKKEDLAKSFLEDSEFAMIAKRYGVYYNPETPVLRGEDIKDLVEPGPKMGWLLERVYQWQIENSVTDRERLRRYVQMMCKEKNKKI